MSLGRKEEESLPFYLSSTGDDFRLKISCETDLVTSMFDELAKNSSKVGYGRLWMLGGEMERVRIGDWTGWTGTPNPRHWPLSPLV